MAFKFFIVMLGLFFLVQVKSSKGHLVKTNCRSFSNSCKTFNDYANDADTYFISDSSFHFVKGTHHLNVTLFIANVFNLSFLGDGSDIILFDRCSIIWMKSFKLFFTSLNLIFNETKKIANNSAIQFENSKVVTFSNASFIELCCELNYYSGAIIVMATSIIFESCKFENGYRSKGGTLYIEDSNVTFWGHNVFLDNVANYTGGAIHGLRSQIQLSGSGVFAENRAGTNYRYINGEGTLYVEFSSISFNGNFKFRNNQIVDKHCWCCINGGAIAASYSSLKLQGDFFFNNNSNCNGGAIWLNNSKCLISGHVNFSANKACLDGGAIRAINSSLIISNEFYLYYNSEHINSESFSTVIPQSIIFYNNSAGWWGGAVYLLESNMTLTGSFIFLASKALYGGGISIDYSSDPRTSNPTFLVFQEPLDITFHENTAFNSGGALYINDAYLNCRQCKSKSSTSNCFFKVNGSINFINLNFKGNKARDGTGIYGGTIQYCQVEVRNQKQRGYQVLQKLMKNSAKIQYIYASCNVYKIDYCNGTNTVEVHRGQVYNISVTAFGEFNFSVREIIKISLKYNDQQSSIKIVNHPYNSSENKGCRSLGFSILSKYEIEVLTIHPLHCLCHPASRTLFVHLEDCPPGFDLKINMCKCRNNIYEVTGYHDLCNSSTGRIKCPQQDWMKPILDENLTYQGFMWSPNCPPHLCRNDKDNWLDFSSDNVDFLCLEHRTAMLCGACLQNYSLTLSSLKCSNCDSNNYLSLLLVFAFAGVALIASLLILHISVADGTVNGLILYANIFDIIDDIVIPQNRIPPHHLTVLISWINLDFGIPTCFYAGLNYYSYTWLQFVFPFYLWFLVGLIILACKYSSRAMKLFGSNPVAVLATVVLMSYNKLLHTSQEILSYATVYYSNGTQEKRWKMDPNLLYFQGKHIPLAMFGIFIVIVFLIPYTVLVSIGYYLQKYSNKRGLKWLIKIKPILDAYYAPYCTNSQYWAGFLLSTRVCLSMTYSALSNKERTTILVIVSSVLTGVALIPWLHQKTYEKNFVNVLEGLFFLNIIVLSITSDHVTTRDLKNSQLILSHTFIGIAFIEFLLIFGFHTWHRLNLKWLYMRYCKNTSAEVSSIQCGATKGKDIDKFGENASMTMIFSIREPLLDGSTEL